MLVVYQGMVHFNKKGGKKKRERERVRERVKDKKRL